ncbi:helix-turn-helix domain-containing protein [Brachyspira hyodysenteriae]|uniref:helix-turn-helix domain-containing protein n=1 Tax=Brachyspira hyodysenteriae TaxID=159 RepID=UPI0022CD7CE7|nr:XRE family transcriptional regulator [Brachyspira hyodysenteriae]MCZ9955580.1 XRE family transcriptional regulator [Brachyspira hyodysenteriae]
MNKNIFNYKRLKNARIYRGLTASEVANQIGISKQAFSKYEVENTNLPLEKVIKISKILNFPLDYFFQNEYIDISNKSVYFRSLLTTNKRCKEEQIVKMKYLSILYSILDEYVLFPNLNIPIELENYTPEYASNKLRELWNLNKKPINNIISIVEKNGIVVAKFDTNTDEIDAFSTLINLENRNLYLIALNKNKKYASRIHFDVAHELGHILLDEWNEDIETLDREEFKKEKKS